MSEENNNAAENTNEAQDAAANETAAETASDAGAQSAAGAEQPQTLLTGAEVKTEANADENAKEGEPKEDEAEKPVEGAPEKYESFNLPEGTQLDEAIALQFSEVAKELNLSQEKAQSVVDKMLPVMAKRQMEQIAAVSQGWAEKSQKDPEISEHWNDIARLRDKFAVNSNGEVDPDIAEFMASPAGNHPGCLKLLARAGRAFGEAGFPKGQPAPRKYTAEDVYK